MARLAPVAGVRIGTANAGIKQKERDDLTLMLLDERATVAGVFTQSAFRAPPVELAEARLKEGRALIINSGNANAATGEAGRADAREVCDAVVEHALELPADSVLPFSTGVIGERLPVEPMKSAVQVAMQSMRENAWDKAAHAIMTTDTVPKGLSRVVEIDGQPVHMTGIAKGSGMIKPNMATMLAFMAVDAAVPAEPLQEMLRRAADASFNRVTVDGDTSTNDSFMLIASGAGPAKITSEAALQQLETAVTEMAIELAKWIAGDGEGASKLVTVEVGGARTQADALAVAYAIAESPLVKTALFAGDPNWGRFCMAIGRADANVDPDRVSLHIEDVCIAQGGMVAPGYVEADAAKVMAGDALTVSVDLGVGDAFERVWTCDFSYDYVRINAEYRT